MGDWHKLVERWQEQDLAPVEREALYELVEEGGSALEDAFFQDLSFGTAGLRGILGAGTNRMNIYTVGRATQALASYLRDVASGRKPRVAIARDSRNRGEEFVHHIAGVLAANGVESYVFERVEPTPLLSFAVRALGMDAGINVTASHNPAAYSGYKVYGPDGCQITSEAAKRISQEMEATDYFDGVAAMSFDAACEAGFVHWIGDETIAAFIDAVMEQSTPDASATHTPLKVSYTPLCGTGLECMSQVFSRLEDLEVCLVEEQAAPDGNFPSCPSPNPELVEALQLAIDLAKREGADLVLATDPDADRVGVAAATEEGFRVLTGNEIGILLLDYLCRMRSAAGKLEDGSICVSTIVSTDMIDHIAQKFGVRIVRTLTGFKYIGDLISGLAAEGSEQKFLLGFEESSGYLSGTHVRDKDAINAGLLICQMAQSHKCAGKSLAQAIDELYQTYGYFANRTLNFGFEGAAGARRMADIMASLRTSAPDAIAGRTVLGTVDYLHEGSGLPAADVVTLELEGDAKIIVRPSGTEPKVKVYLFVRESSAQNAQAALDELEHAAGSLMR